MTSLYEINKELNSIMESREEGSIEEIESKLDQIQIQFNDKLNNICKYVSNIESDISAIDNEIKRLQNIKKSKTTKIDNLKDYMSYILQQQGIEKLDLELYRISFRKSDQVIILDQDKIPDEYIIEKVSTTVDKTKIKDAIKAGSVIDGATIQVKKNLQIK